MADEPVVRSVGPKPDREMVEVIMRLKVNPDFVKFRDTMITGRVGVLALLSTSATFTDKQSHLVQGRVHELVDLNVMIDKIEDTRAEFEANKAQGG